MIVIKDLEPPDENVLRGMLDGSEKLAANS